MSIINVTQLQKRNALYIANITQGMERYPYYILEGSEDLHQTFLLELTKINTDQSYVDFYYKRIDAKGQELINQYLDETQQMLLENILTECREAKVEEEFVILPLREDMLSLMLHISFCELLFSTFYFITSTCTVWSNYGGRFLLFMKKQEECQSVVELAKKIGLRLEQ